MSDFIFNGVSAASMGLTVERHPVQATPQKRIKRISIPGRSGDLIQWDGAWEHFTQRYICWFKSAPVARQAHKIKEWLMTAPAGARLEDTYDSSVFHHATFSGPMDIESVLNRYGRCTLEFDCAPQAWYKGWYDVALSFKGGSGTVNNNGPFPAYPLIEIDVAVSAHVTIGGKTFAVQNPAAETTGQAAHLTIDTYLKEAWVTYDDGTTEEVANNLVSRLYAVVLPPGNTTVKITGDNAIRIFVRSWTL